MSSTNPARGMRDFLPDAVRKRNYVIGIIREVYEKYGFEPLETPSIENLSTLTNKYGEEGDQLMFKILKRGQKLEKQLKRDDAKENDLTDLALRYDLTVPLARVIANYRHELPRFFKRYQIQPVWRADRPAKGRYREFYQCDVDAIGSKSMLVEAELILAVSEILQNLGFDDYSIKINHRGILTSMLEFHLIAKDKQTEVLTAIDKLDKIGLDGVKREIKKLGLTDLQMSELELNFFASFKRAAKLDFDFFNNLLELYIHVNVYGLEEAFPMFDDIFPGLSQQVLSYQEENVFVNESLNDSINDLRNKVKPIAGIAILNLLQIFTKVKGLDETAKIKLDPSLARGLSYYTGAIFEVVLTNGDFTGSIAGGGRYDGLIGMFGKEEIPAVGLSIGLERILYVMEERGMFPDDLQTNSADVLVTIWNEESAGESLKLANELRQKDLRVFVYPQADKLGKQFKYANQIDVEYVCVLGDNELSENTVQVKNMKTGEQENIAREEIAEKINSMQ